jgi:signal peptidase I
VSRRRGVVREYVEAALWALALTLLLRAFVVQAFRIPSPSMEPTLQVGDFLFVNKFEFGARVPFSSWRLPGLRAPRAGDVIVFQFPPDPSKDYIKRVVATSGQTLEIRDKTVFVDGVAAREPFVQHRDPTVRPGGYDFRDNYGPYTVPAGHLFMMGDNRDDSYDSRFWGPLDFDLVKGRAMFIYWSWDSEQGGPRWNRLLRPIH